MTDIIKSFSKSLTDRFDNPLSGTFIIAWLLVNWKITLTVIFGSLPQEDRVLSVGHIVSNYDGAFYFLFFLPLLFSGAYAFGMPLLKEGYQGWLNKSEYRTLRKAQQLNEDLKEEEEYRGTLKALCAALKKDLNDAKQALHGISLLSKAGQDPEKGDFYSEIERVANKSLKNLNDTTAHIQHFFNNYNGELPAAYQFFLSKRGNNSSELILPSIETND